VEHLVLQDQGVQDPLNSGVGEIGLENGIHCAAIQMSSRLAISAHVGLHSQR
jgi:hypothetical protein